MNAALRTFVLAVPSKKIEDRTTRTGTAIRSERRGSPQGASTTRATLRLPDGVGRPPSGKEGVEVEGLGGAAGFALFERGAEERLARQVVFQQ
jgi:hypothetical protein